MKQRKRILLLGASGSIGMQTIDVIQQHPDEFELVSFGVGRNIEAAKQILEQFDVKRFSVQYESDAEKLRPLYPNHEILSGMDGMIQLVKEENYDVLVNALVGFAGFLPTYEAIRSCHDVALANKETLVAGGKLINDALVEYGVSLYPIDSEHSAIFQCLQGNAKQDVKRLWITASGGSFRNLKREMLKDVTVEQALAHPNWSMGAKITVDSATMMNKGFEVMEAHWLFDLPYDKISVLMHAESVIHSMVEYQDNSIIAQLGNPDMRLPIQYSLTWPRRLALQEDKPFSLAKIGTLHFEDPDFERFPLLKLAFEVGEKGGNLPAILNAANEVANAAFRNHELSFLGIEEVIFQTVNHATYQPIETVEDLIEANNFGTTYAEHLIKEHIVA